jgi:hypothetical protein
MFFFRYRRLEGMSDSFVLLFQLCLEILKGCGTIKNIDHLGSCLNSTLKIWDDETLNTGYYFFR